MNWKDWTLIVGTLGAFLRFIWVSVFDGVSIRDFFSRKGKREVEKQRIQSEEERAIYQRLSERVESLNQRVEENRQEIHKWRENYLQEKEVKQELRVQNERISRQNDLLNNANQRLQKSISVLHIHLQQVLERLAQYEDIGGGEIPELPDLALSISSIDHDLLKNIANPDVDTPMGEVFEGYRDDDLKKDMSKPDVG